MRIEREEKRERNEGKRDFENRVCLLTAKRDVKMIEEKGEGRREEG